MRIDKLLWFLRLAKSRSAAQALAGAGHVRRNGERVTRLACDCAIGDILVVPLSQGVRVVEIVAIPARRGPPVEAQACYRPLDEPRPAPLAAAQEDTFQGTSPP